MNNEVKADASTDKHSIRLDRDLANNWGCTEEAEEIKALSDNAVQCGCEHARPADNGLILIALVG